MFIWKEEEGGWGERGTGEEAHTGRMGAPVTTVVAGPGRVVVVDVVGYVVVASSRRRDHF